MRPPNPLIMPVFARSPICAAPAGAVLRSPTPPAVQGIGSATRADDPAATAGTTPASPAPEAPTTFQGVSPPATMPTLVMGPSPLMGPLVFTATPPTVPGIPPPAPGGPIPKTTSAGSVVADTVVPVIKTAGAVIIALVVVGGVITVYSISKT